MIVIDAGNTNIVIGFYTKNKLRKIIRLNTKKNVMILAYTGIVSIKCRGRTIHSFLSLIHI